MRRFSRRAKRQRRTRPCTERRLRPRHCHTPSTPIRGCGLPRAGSRGGRRGLSLRVAKCLVWPWRLTFAASASDGFGCPRAPPAARACCGPRQLSFPPTGRVQSQGSPRAMGAAAGRWACRKRGWVRAARARPLRVWPGTRFGAIGHGFDALTGRGTFFRVCYLNGRILLALRPIGNAICPRSKP